jgi:hypothetical protein
VLVRNRWIGVNWVDLQHVAGTPYPTAVPFVPGTEAAGEVMAVGSRVRDLAAGAPVVHFGHMGGVYAEYTAVPAGHVVPLDDPGLVRDAAALAINGTTAHVLLRDAAGVRPGQVVVVQAVLYGQSGGPVSPVDPAVLSGLQDSSRRKGSLALRWANAGGDYLADPAARRSAMRQVLGAVSGGRLGGKRLWECSH